MGGAGFFGEVELPEGFEIWSGLDDVQSGWAAALCRAAVHDGDARGGGVNENGAAALIEAVVGRDVDVYFAHFVLPGNMSSIFFVGGQITEIEDAPSLPKVMRTPIADFRYMAGRSR